MSRTITDSLGRHGSSGEPIPNGGPISGVIESLIVVLQEDDVFGEQPALDVAFHHVDQTHPVADIGPDVTLSFVNMDVFTIWEVREVRVNFAVLLFDDLANDVDVGRSGFWRTDSTLNRVWFDVLLFWNVSCCSHQYSVLATST